MRVKVCSIVEGGSLEHAIHQCFVFLASSRDSRKNRPITIKSTGRYTMLDLLTELNSDHALYEVADECMSHLSESYYMVISDQKESQPDD